MKSLLVAFGLVSLLAGCASGAADDGEASASDLVTDGRDPAQARGDRDATTTTLFGRTFTLHVSDADDSAWASIENGSPTDQVWLDRSYDGGGTYTGQLGKTAIPTGSRGWRTLMYRLDDTTQHSFGAVRACGKAGDRDDVACTPWARSTTYAGTPSDAAALAMMQFYNPGTGLWPKTGWWNGANALTALVDYSSATGSTTFRYAIDTTFTKNNGSRFTNDYMDDTAWWGLAWLRAYDLTKDARYLAAAQHITDYVWSFHDDTCGGGIWWSTAKKYKNAITNELFLKLAAGVHMRTAGDTFYLAEARETWRWFSASGMINAQHLINDGLDATTCKNNGTTEWTYNQGVILGGLVELHRATGDDTLLDAARAIAGAATTDPTLSPGGVLREPCETGSGGCGSDGPTFKGVFVRNLGELDRYLPDHPYRAWLGALAATAQAHDRNALDQYGVRWAGPFDSADPARQSSALDLLTAATAR